MPAAEAVAAAPLSTDGEGLQPEPRVAEIATPAAPTRPEETEGETGQGGAPSPSVSSAPEDARLPVPPVVAAISPPKGEDEGTVEAQVAAQQASPPSPPRGPFDIVLDRPAPTGREGAALPPAEPAPEGGNPWRLTTGLLLVAGLIGGAAVAYREAHRQPPPPDVFAPLKSSPHPQMVLAFDPEAGDVVVRHLDEPPPAGMVYRIWLVSHQYGTRAVCTFTEAGRCPSGALGDVGRAGLMAGVLQVTLEPAALALATPTGKVVFYGRALTR